MTRRRDRDKIVASNIARVLAGAGPRRFFERFSSADA
jgi:hypothetical protein